MLDDKLHEILDYLGETYYPVHEYNDTHPEENEAIRNEAIAQIHKAFKDEYELIPRKQDEANND